MNVIDEARLEQDIGYRFDYLAEFIGFGPPEMVAIQGCAMYLGPMIPELVERTYAKLLNYTATARHFVPRQHGFTGTVPANLEALTAQHPQIQFRKEHLGRYLQQLLGKSCDAKLAMYLDMVGKIHTPKAGNAEIDVPLIQMNALMGLLSDTITEAIFSMPLDQTTMRQTIRSFNKLLWIQNDLITRHYRVQ